MLKILLLTCAMLAQLAVADTPPPGSVKAKVYSGDGVTAVTTTGTALDVNVTNSGGTSTVNQGTAGLSPWLVHADNTAFGRSWTLLNSTDSVNAVQSGTWTTGRTWSLNSGSDSVSIVGSVTATNSANGNTGSPVPAQATQVAGSDGTNLRALKVSSTGVLSVDGSSSTQPVSGSVSVANFPSVQAVSQSGTWTIGQGTPPWDFNLTQLAGASFSQTNYLPSRLTNGTAYVDPTQIRALTSGDVVTANQGGSWSVSVLNFPATQPVSGTVAVSNFPATQPISAAALPLPSGAATSANQTTANSSLSSIDSKTPTLGQALAAASVPVVLTAAQLSTLTPLSTVAVTQSTSPWVVSGTVSATQSGTWNINNISGTVSLPTGAATAANQSTANTSLSSIDSKLTSPLAVSQSGTWNINNVSGTVSLPTGASTSALQTSGNASLTSIDSKTPALGQAAMSASSPVVVASDQSLSTGAQRVATGNLTAQCTTPASCAAGTTVSVATAGANAVTFNSSGTFTATITFETSNDGGTTWTAIQGIDPLTQGLSTTNSTTGRTLILSAPGQTVRARCSAYTSGTAVVTLTANRSNPYYIYSAQAGSWTMQGSAPEGNSIAGVFPLIVGGTYTSTLPTLTTGVASHFHMDAAGRLLVSNNGLTGTVNSGATDAGSPVKVGGVYRSTPITLTDGQRGDLQLNAEGATRVAVDGLDSVTLVRNDYSSVNVTTSAYTQLIASTSDITNQIFIFDSSGQTLVLAVGAAGSEVNKLYIVPGGNGLVPLNIASGVRVSVKAISASATAGELSISFLK